MALTPKLGTADSILGVSQILGSPDEGALAFGLNHSLGLSAGASGVVVGPIRVSNFSVQVLWSPGLLSEAAENTLALEDLALDFLVVGDRQIVDQSIDFVQASDFGEKRGIDTLDLVQVASFTGPRYESAQNNLGLQQGIVDCFGAPWVGIEVEQSLGLVDIAGRGRFQTVNQSINFVQDSFRVFAVEQSLGLSQVLNGGRFLDVHQELNLSDSFSGNAILNRTLTQGDVVKQAFTYFFSSGCDRKRYARFEGAGQGSGIPIQRTEFDAQFSVETVTGPKTVVQLRSPEMDDRHRISFTRVNRETRGGELNVFADPLWPEASTLLFTITNLKKSQADALQEFFQSTLGQQIKLHDWTGTSWLGVVTTPNEVATEDHTDRWTVLFEFEGVEFEGSTPDNQLSLEHTVVLAGDWVRVVTNSLSLIQELDVSPISEGDSHALDFQQSAVAVVV